MEDNNSAKIFLSEITGLDIISLRLLPQELSVEVPTRREDSPSPELSVYRLDFSANVRESDGSRKVIIIELQKSKYWLEVMRFRKYLGKQYMNDRFSRWLRGYSGKKYKIGHPIFPIYILGDSLDDLEDIPVISVNNEISDHFLKRALCVKNHFIESLYHQGIIIQVPALKGKRRDELEILLSIFDQSNRLKNHHIMGMKETDFPERFQPIVRRLQAAAAERKVREKMILEDEFLAEFEDYGRQVVKAKKQEEEAVRKKREAERQKEEAERQKEEAERQKEIAIKLLLDIGLSTAEIASKLGIPEEKIIHLINN